MNIENNDNLKTDKAGGISGNDYKIPINNIKDAVFLFEIDVNGMPGSIIEVNDAACERTGFKREKLIQMNFLDLGYGSNQSDASKFIKKIRNNENFIYEHEYEAKDGAGLSLEINACPMIIGNKTYVTAIIRDINFSKAIEHELIMKSFAVESSSASICISDMTGRIKYVNNAMLKLFKYDDKIEVLGSSVFDYVEKPDAVILMLDRVIKEGNVQGEGRVCAKDKTLLEVQIYVSLIKDKIDNNIGIIASFLDLSGKNKYEQELIIAKEKAEESEKLKSAFLANMSHEIRTPMNGIIGFADLLNDAGLTEDEKKYYTGIIIKSGHQLLSIVDDMLDISRIDLGQLKINIENINLNNLLNEIMLASIDKAKAKGINLLCKKEFEDEKSFILTDGIRLKQIITNLINNSVKFTNDGYVRYGYNLEGDKLVFYVEDTGIGIRKEFYNNLFKRFSQTDSEKFKVTGGAGLGLSICKGLVDLLGGEIWFESIHKKGSKFHFIIPYNAEDKTVDLKAVTGRKILKPSILVAEDEVINFLYLEKILTKKGYDVFHAKNGIEAIKSVKADPNIKLVLMDIKMPEMDGIEAAALIKKEHPGLPIVAVTAYAMKEEEEKILQSGLEGYISKPINTKKLFEIIEQYIGKR